MIGDKHVENISIDSDQCSIEPSLTTVLSFDTLSDISDPPFHTFGITQTVSLLSSDLKVGLKHDDAQGRLERDGYNILKGEGGISPIKLFLQNLINGMSIVLFVAVIVSFATMQWVEAVVILVINVSNAIIGFFQEYKSEKALDALKKMSSPTATVIRGGEIITIDTPRIVVGDLVVFEAGDILCADVRIIESTNLMADEALLTGESLPVEKTNETLEQSDESIGDRINIGFMSTLITRGKGKGIVIATGMNTQIGAIAKKLQSNSGSKSSPLRRKLDILAYIVFGLAIVLAVLVMAVNEWEFEDKTYVLYAISVGICAIPEGLPAVLTLTMSAGVHSMTKQHAIVRRINALETLGAVNHICSDKTGTLTQAKMFAERIWQMDAIYKISGTGFNIEGEVLLEHNQEPVENYTEALSHLIVSASLCNNAEVNFSVDDEEDVSISIDENHNDNVRVVGDPTEIALQVLAHKTGYSKPLLLEKGHTLVAENPFDSTIKRMSVVFQKSHTYAGYMKGAPEQVLSCCMHVHNGDRVDALDSLAHATLSSANLNLASQGLRVLAIAYRPNINAEDAKSREDTEKDFIFLGFVGIYDPPRLESQRAVEICHRAGIVVHMATGDHPVTAKAISLEIGILPKDYDESMITTAKEFDMLDDATIDAMEQLPLVVARCSPDTKVKLVSALHRRKQLVAMTGDGVNDAPALKTSDIGIAMGKTGSDVAKQASDIVLTDDNFATLVTAVSTGRRILINVMKIMTHLFSGNIAQVSMLLIGLAIMDERRRSIFPISPLQALWINLITSAPPAIGLGYERQSKDTMRRKPKSVHKRLTNTELIMDVFTYGLWQGCLSIAAFVATIYIVGDGNLGYRCNKLTEESRDCETIFRARAVTFLSLSATLILTSFNCKQPRKPLWKTNYLKNKVLLLTSLLAFFFTMVLVYIPFVNEKIFVMSPMTGYDWVVVFISTITYMVGVELYKGAKRCFLPNKTVDMTIPLDDMEWKAIKS